MIEPDTLIWLYEGYLCQKPVLMAQVSDYITGEIDIEEQVVYNLALSTAFARIKYWTIPDPLPEPTDITGLAGYWYKHYQTPEGKGTIPQWLSNYKNLVST